MGAGILRRETLANHIIVSGHWRALTSPEQESPPLKLLETVALFLLMILNLLTCCKRIFAVVLGKADWNILKHICRGLCFSNVQYYSQKENSEGKNNAVQDSSRQNSAVFTKKKSCHFSNQVVLNWKESYYFCMCIHMIYVLFIEQWLP